MTKIQRISHLQHEFSFLNPSDNFNLYYTRFLESDLGKIHAAIPWEDLVFIFKLKESKKAQRIILAQRVSLP